MIIPNEYIIPTKIRWRCLYCGAQCKLCCASLVYHGSKKYGNVWVCPTPDCDAYVGAHKGTNIPKGHPANAELRELRMQCHREFDPIWQRRMQSIPPHKPEGKRKQEVRHGLYKELAEYMELPIEMTHFACFSMSQCLKAFEFIRITIEKEIGELA